MENNSLLLFYLFFILTPFSIFFGIKFRKWKYNNHCLFLECIFILICLTIACFQDSEPHYLLGMTKFQEIILFCVGISYVVDASDIIESYQETKNPKDIRLLLMHHIPGYIGIAYMLYAHQCGGIIVRFLFDCVDYTLQLLEFISDEKYSEFLDDLQEIAFFVLRVCYYSSLGIYGIYIMICYWSFIDKILFALYVTWTLYVLYDHIYLGFCLKNRFKLVKIYKKWFKNDKTKKN